jgi:hypothetical protein
MPGTIRLGPLGEAPVSAVRASAYSPRANPNRARSGRVGERCTCPLAQLQDLQERREAAHARRGGARHSSECRCSAWSCAGNAQTCCASRCIALFVRVQQQHGVELLLFHHIPHLLKSLGAQLHRAVVGPGYCRKATRHSWKRCAAACPPDRCADGRGFRLRDL